MFESLRSRELLAATALLAAFTLAPQNAAAQSICLIGELEQAQEVPPSGSPGKGTVVFLVNTAANTVTYRMTMNNLTSAETAAHIHGFVPSGVNGPVQTALPLGATKAGVWAYAAADEAAILNGLTYVNVHTAAFPGGELRAQMKRDLSNATLVALLDGLQEVPATASPATGTGWFSVDTTAKTVTYQITRTGPLTGPETAAHIHGFAPPGANAGIKQALPGGFHKQGLWLYAAADEAGILGGLLYVNIHSTAFPGGEIRGQVQLACKCSPAFTTYCTAGTTTSGCSASISASGLPSATLSTGFTISASGVEGNKDGLFFFGVNGQQANPWGNGTSFQCVVPPVQRAGLLSGSGTPGACDGSFSQDLNARWCPSCPKPAQNPGAGAVVQAQLWFRDPGNTSNQTTSLSDAVEFTVCP